MEDQIKNYVNCHWFQGSFESHLIPVVRQCIEDFYATHFFMAISWEHGVGINGYQSSLRYDDKIMILYDDNEDFSKRIHNNKSCVCFTGTFFDLLPFHLLPEFASIVSLVKVSRFDMYYQDERRVQNVFDIFNSFKRGCCRGFTSYRYIDSGSRGCQKGDTLELGRRGSRGSGKFLRIYDKLLESEGLVEGIRWELEWSGKRAVSAWDMWKANDFSASSCAGFIFATVDWIEPTKDQHRNRWQRLAWYSELINSVEELITVPVVVESTNAEKKDKWLKNSVSGTLAYMRAFLYFTDGSEGFTKQLNNYLCEGTTKLSRSLKLQLKKDIEKFSCDPDWVGTPSLSEIDKFLRSSNV